jgi:hypothetical protein
VPYAAIQNRVARSRVCGDTRGDTGRSPSIGAEDRTEDLLRAFSRFLVTQGSTAVAYHHAALPEPGPWPHYQGPIDPGSRSRSRNWPNAASAAHRWSDAGVTSFRMSWATLATRWMHVLLAMNWCPAGQNWGSRGAQRRRLMLP